MAFHKSILMATNSFHFATWLAMTRQCDETSHSYRRPYRCIVFSVNALLSMTWFSSSKIYTRWPTIVLMWLLVCGNLQIVISLARYSKYKHKTKLIWIELIWIALHQFKKETMMSITQACVKNVILTPYEKLGFIFSVQIERVVNKSDTHKPRVECMVGKWSMHDLP
jgi:hypothetical protein